MFSDAAHMVLAVVRTDQKHVGLPGWHGHGLGLQRPQKDLEVFLFGPKATKDSYLNFGESFIYATSLNCSLQVGIDCHGAKDDFLFFYSIYLISFLCCVEAGPSLFLW